MNKIARYTLAAGVVLGCAMGATTPANAQFFATICNDIQCTGGDDLVVQDNAAGDTALALGAISFSAALFGYTFEVNTSQSKPMVGSAAAPQLDLSFTATTGAAPVGTLFLNISDIGYSLASGSSLLALAGTNSGGSGSVVPAPVAHTGSVKLGARVRPGWFAQTHAHPEWTGRALVDILHRGDDHRRHEPADLAGS